VTNREIEAEIEVEREIEIEGLCVRVREIANA